jgi:uncharacterized protein YggE
LKLKGAKMKKSWIFLSFLVILALAACTPAPAPAADQGTLRQVSVTGVGEVYLNPDIAYVSIGVHSESDSVMDALDQNNAAAQAISKELQGMGVDKKDIQTTAFNVYPQQQYGPNGETKGTVYVVDNSVYVTVRDLQKLGEMLDAVVRSGANTINSISFDVADKSAAFSEARKLAVDDAISQAKELAAAAGVELGDLVSMSAYSSGSPMPVYQGKGGAMAMAPGEVPVAAGQLVLTMNANLTYEIK